MSNFINAFEIALGVTAANISLGLELTGATLVPAEYKGLVVAAFDVEEDAVEKGKIRFTNTITVSDTTKATFLTNVTEEGLSPSSLIGRDKFTATKVNDPTELLEEGKIPLFCVHGFQGRPDIWINSCKDIAHKLSSEGPDQSGRPKKEYQIIPVLWPGDGNVTGPIDPSTFLKELDIYKKGQYAAAMGAKAFKKAFDNIDKIERKSILATSMGNWFLKILASESKNDDKMAFEDIFMHAADLDEDVFDNEEGTNIVDMLSKGSNNNEADEGNNGKVYIIHNHNDAILASSALFRRENKVRLGSNGTVSKPPPPRVQNVDVTKKQSELRNPTSHGYIFDDYMIDFYKQNEPKQTNF